MTTSEIKYVEYNDLTKGILQNVKKIDTDGSLRGYSPLMRNMHPLPNGGIRSSKGYSDFLSSAISGTPTITSGFDFVDKDGTQRTIITTSDGKLRLYSGSNFNTELTTGLTTGVTLVWCWFTFFDGTNIYAIGMNGQGDFIKTDGTGGGTASVSGSPPANPKWGAAWKDRIFVSDGNYLYPSGVLDEDSWDTTNDKLLFADDHELGIRAVVPYGNDLIVSKRSAIYHVIHKIPNLVNTSAFQIKRLDTENGFDNGNAWVYLPSGEIEFKGEEDYYLLSGNSVRPSGGSYIQGYFNPNLNYENIDRSRREFFTSAKIKSNYQAYHIFATTGTTNHAGLIHDYSRQKPSWFPIKNTPFHSLFNYRSAGREILLAGGIGDGMVYRLDQGETYADDAVDAEYQTFWDTLNDPDAIKVGLGIEFLFEAPATSSPTIYLAKDFDVKTEVSRAITIGSSGDQWGTGEWGTFVWGEGGNASRGFVKFEPHPDTSETGLGEFKALRIRIANTNLNEPFVIYGFRIYYTIIQRYARRD